MVNLAGQRRSQREQDIEGEDVGEDSGVCVPCILEAGDPFHGWVVVVGLDFAATLQVARWVGEDEGLHGEAIGALRRFPTRGPAWQ